MSESSPKEPLAASTIGIDSESQPHAPGERQGVLMLTGGEHAGRVISLAASKPITLGRSDECSVMLPDPALSRVHAEFIHIGNDYVVRDLNSRNGTFVNDARVEGVHRLSNGDRIRLGSSTSIRFSLLNTDEVATLVGLAAGERVTSIVEGARAPASVRRAGSRFGASERVVQDPALTAVYEQAFRAAKAPISVLILGETGVGKEVLARAIHQASPRAAQPFLALNCAALSENLLEAELFGHERGAFTGAHEAKAGLFEAAHGGTVFLDEVGELPPSTQAKLLRVLEERKVRRVGGRVEKDIDVRFISATNRDIEAASKDGFREDLLFRLNGFTLTIPPLRERRKEIRSLAELFAETALRQMGRSDEIELSPEFVQRLESHHFPGNVRELKGVIERAVILCDGRTLREEHLPARILQSSRAPDDGTEPPGDLRSARDEFEKQRVMAVLEQCGGNQTKAAEQLNMSRRALVARLTAWGLTRPRKQTP